MPWKSFFTFSLYNPKPQCISLGYPVTDNQGYPIVYYFKNQNLNSVVYTLRSQSFVASVWSFPSLFCETAEAQRWIFGSIHVSINCEKFYCYSERDLDFRCYCPKEEILLHKLSPEFITRHATWDKTHLHTRYNIKNKSKACGKFKSSPTAWCC